MRVLDDARWLEGDERAQAILDAARRWRAAVAEAGRCLDRLGEAMVHGEASETERLAVRVAERIEFVGPRAVRELDSAAVRAAEAAAR